MSFLEQTAKGEAHKGVPKPVGPILHLVSQPKADAIPPTKGVSGNGKGMTKGGTNDPKLAPKPLVNGKKNPVHKGESQLVWKPKARASGHHDVNILQGVSMEMEDPLYDVLERREIYPRMRPNGWRYKEQPN